MKNLYSRLKWLVIILIAILLFMVAKPANASFDELAFQQEVNGVVTDQSGIPLPGVTVSILGENKGVVTDMDGKYSITVSHQNQLIFSFLGFKTMEEAVLGRDEINIQLEEDISQLGEVQINAGYYNTTRRESTGNISRVTAEEIERQPVTNPLAAMQGRMPGVNITQTTGVPGGGFEVQVRGINSIGAGTDPLYIIDGVPFSSQSLGSVSISGLVFPGNISPLNSLNASDIESIEVLKDADATAIYGSRGANGVVLISTKRGRAGKARLEINMFSGIGEIANKAKLMNTDQYLEMRKEAFANDGIEQYPPNAYDINGTWDQNRYTDWQEELIGNQAKQHEIGLRLSGGNDQTNFLVGGSYRNETTVFPGDNAYQKASFLTNINHLSKDNKLNLNFTANYVVDKNDLPGSDLTRYTRNLAPNAPELYNEDGSLNWANNTWANPLASYVNERFISNSNNLIANATFSYELLKKLSIKTNLGYNTINLEDNKISPSTRFNPAFNLDSRNSLVFKNSGNRQSWIIEPQMHWNWEWQKLSSEILVGATFQEDKRNQQTFLAINFPSNQLLNDISAASNLILLNNEAIDYRYQAYFGRINFNWDQKYIINLTGRRDGSSRFGPSNSYSNFGAVGIAWIFSEEKFLQEQEFLNYGKIRGSYGVTGNDQIGDYEYLDTYTLTGRNYNNTSGLAPTHLYNPNFGWETNKKLEIGLELEFFDNKIFSAISYYLNHSGDQLVGVPLPGTTGFSTLRANLEAEIENTGWEFEITTTNSQSENFTWNSSFNLTIPRNELVSYPGLENSTYANSLVIGKPLNIEKLYELKGVNPQTGVYDFVDFNGDGKISSPDDRQFIVNLDPAYYGGFGNDLTYQNWNLNIFFQFVSKENYNHLLGLPGGMINQTVDVLNRWQQPGDIAPIQRYTSGGNSDAVAAYTFFDRSNGVFSDASFIRLKNLYLSYQIPLRFRDIFTAKIYFQGQNLWTLTDFKGADPESNSLSSLPPLRQLIGGIQLTF